MMKPEQVLRLVKRLEKSPRPDDQVLAVLLVCYLSRRRKRRRLGYENPADYSLVTIVVNGVLCGYWASLATACRCMNELGYVPGRGTSENRIHRLYRRCLPRLKEAREIGKRVNRASFEKTWRPYEENRGGWGLKTILPSRILRGELEDLVEYAGLVIDEIHTVKA
jgi:hypothetical protein